MNISKYACPKINTKILHLQPTTHIPIYRDNFREKFIYILNFSLFFFMPASILSVNFDIYPESHHFFLSPLLPSWCELLSSVT